MYGLACLVSATVSPVLGGGPSMQHLWQGWHPLTPVPSLAPSEILAVSGFYSFFFVYTVLISAATEFTSCIHPKY
jgi:hypothetical protein